ncbi:hypothetical protein M5K25_003266 [Dendrobium thyrsiflorum]|uniref:Uncharacterized protein n=1 Tax=Dendrobium thyrsiflorum TaxID=117978 RepID=A0ABD0VXS0_DENTH
MKGTSSKEPNEQLLAVKLETRKAVEEVTPAKLYLTRSNEKQRVERKALHHGDHGNSLTYIQQAANAALNGAIGPYGYFSPASKKRKNQDLFFGTSVQDQSIHSPVQYPNVLP